MRARDPFLLGEALLTYAAVRVTGQRRALRPLLEGAGPARRGLDPGTRRTALLVDNNLRRAGARCLSRSIVVARVLRRRGVDALVSFSVAAGNPREAHAEVEIGGVPLRPRDPDHVMLR